uniref:RIKEN cDNA 2810408A11 gene n=1 Tax=Peromyscus maniculatus bairdii TaxID=230844 RepID=A0A8C8U140_PERMB
MEKPEPLASVSGLSAESPRGVPRAIPGGVRGIPADTGLPPGVALFRAAGPLSHPGGIVIRSPGPIRHSEEAVTLSSGPCPQLGEVAGSSLGSSKSSGAARGSIPGPGESKVYSSESSPQSGPTFLHSQNFEERPRSILKNSSSILMKKTSSGEKSSRHLGRKPGERGLQDNDEDLSAGSSPTVTPESLSERFATMDNFLPKVLQYGDNKNSKTADTFAKTHSSDFDKHRKIHYNEGKFLKTLKSLPLTNEDDSSGTSASISSSSQSGLTDPKPRPAEKGWPGRLAPGVKNDTVLVTDSRGLDANDSAAFRNQFPAASDSAIREQTALQRKEYYSQGRYLRSCSHPEIGEAMEDEEMNSLTWVIENPKGTSDDTLRLQWTQEKEPRPWKM